MEMGVTAFVKLRLGLLVLELQAPVQQSVEIIEWFMENFAMMEILQTLIDAIQFAQDQYLVGHVLEEVVLLHRYATIIVETES